MVAVNDTYQLHFRNKTLNAGHRTVIMGILNVTPDSFSDGGEYFNDTAKAVNRAEQMLDQGADIIDIGGESLRPGSVPLSVTEELQRVIPVVKAVRHKLGDHFFIAVDTYKAQVAQEALAQGADIVNNVGGMTLDPDMARVVSVSGCPVVIYHMRGTPQTMQQGDIVYDDVVETVYDFFEERIRWGVERGVKREQFIIDPGIGFGKTVEHNVELIRRLGEFRKLRVPILIGVSRKGHLGTILKNELQLEKTPAPLERIEPSLAETAIAIWNGAHIVRTHDVLQTKRFTTIIDYFKKDEVMEHPLDTIYINDLCAHCIIGVHETERQEKQPVVINLALSVNVSQAAQSDALADSVDYHQLYRSVLDLVEHSQFHLIEALAESIARLCLMNKQVRRVKVRLEKPHALALAGSSAIEITRENGS